MKATNKKIYIFKDADGYFVGCKGTCIVRKITEKQYKEFKEYLPEYGVRKKWKLENVELLKRRNDNEKRVEM